MAGHPFISSPCARHDPPWCWTSLAPVQPIQLQSLVLFDCRDNAGKPASWWWGRPEAASTPSARASQPALIRSASASAQGQRKCRACSAHCRSALRSSACSWPSRCTNCHCRKCGANMLHPIGMLSGWSQNTQRHLLGHAHAGGAGRARGRADRAAAVRARTAGAALAAVDRFVGQWHAGHQRGKQRGVYRHCVHISSALYIAIPASITVC